MTQTSNVADDSASNTSATPPITNKAATVAMTAGLLSIIPGVGLIAIVAGLIGGTRAQANGGVGRGRVFVGVTLGIGSLFLWAVVIGALLEGRARQHAVPAVNATKKLIMLIGSGNVAGAKAMTTDAVDVNMLTDTAEQFAKWGSFKGEISAYAGRPMSYGGVQVEYRLPFESTVQIFSGDWVFEDGQPRLTAYRLHPEVTDATTQPTGK